MDLFEKVSKSKNKIIEESYIDYLNFNEKEKRTEQGLIEEIRYNIYKACNEYQQWGNDGDYTYSCIRTAKKFLANLLIK